MNEQKRMLQLAGLLTESVLNEAKYTLHKWVNNNEGPRKGWVLLRALSDTNTTWKNPGSFSRDDSTHQGGIITFSQDYNEANGKNFDYEKLGSGLTKDEIKNLILSKKNDFPNLYLNTRVNSGNAQHMETLVALSNKVPFLRVKEDNVYINDSEFKKAAQQVDNSSIGNRGKNSGYLYKQKEIISDKPSFVAGGKPYYLVSNPDLMVKLVNSYLMIPQKKH